MRRFYIFLAVMPQYIFVDISKMVTIRIGLSNECGNYRTGSNFDTDQSVHVETDFDPDSWNWNWYNRRYRFSPFIAQGKFQK